MKTLEMDQTHTGQWRYRVLQACDDSVRVSVDWEYGSRNEKDTLSQAEDRFGPFDKVVIEDWI